MKYLYIPTSTLNFNNILSTGSISPAAVYAARRFGYNKLEVVPPNPFQSILVLYERYPIFTIEDVDRDNHPLVIRIRADHISNELRMVGGVHVCDTTIYLVPASTEFLFATPEAKKIALIKAEPSLTTKLIGLYQSRMQVVGLAQNDSFKWSKEMLDNISDNSSESVIKNCESDDLINRLKGFACGYILGAYKSIDEKRARYRSVLKEQRNEISAMLNDPSKNHSGALRNAFDACSTLDLFWTEERVVNRRFDPEKGDKIVIDSGRIAALEDIHVSDPQSTLRLRRLFNNYCITSNFTGQLDEARLSVALDGAKAIKALMGVEWENSSNQAYINALLNNIKSGSPFEFNSSSSLAIQSFAAFVLKGDDLDKLETFLVDQGIGDFRFAFALWGAMFGFSKIPKTVYNLPDKLGEYSYTRKMHDYVHSVVHGTEVNLSPPEPPPIEDTLPKDLPPELFKDFQQQFPGAAHWVPSMVGLWNKCSGAIEIFLKNLSDASSTDLGGRAKNGTSKKEVTRFFKGALESQPKLSVQPSFLTTEQKILKFCDDPRAWEIVPYKYQQAIQKELIWFQKEWKDQESAYYGKQSKSRIKDKPLNQRTNFDAIKYFTRILKKNLEETAVEEIYRLLIRKYH